jgi:hypothetical protein
LLHASPGAHREPQTQPLAGVALLADDPPYVLELLGKVLIRSGNIVEGVGDLAKDARCMSRDADAEITHPHGLEGAHEIVQVAI